MRWFLCAFLLLLCCAFALAGDGFAWIPSPDDADCHALFFNGKQIGCWRESESSYRPLLASGEWGEATAPPLAPPIAAKKCGCARGCNCQAKTCRCKPHDKCCDGCDCQKGISGDNFGVVTQKIGAQGERYLLRDKEISRQRASDILTGGGKIPDDRDKLSLSFIGGTEEERKEAIATAQGLGLDKHCIIKAFAANDPLVQCGFATDHQVYLQEPSGKVLARCADWTEKGLGAIRKAVPDYDKTKDPDPTKPADSLKMDLEKFFAAMKADLATVPTPFWLVAGGVAIWLLVRKENAK